QGIVLVKIKRINDSSNLLVTVKDNGPGINREALNALNLAIKNDNIYIDINECIDSQGGPHESRFIQLYTKS
ncbi:hypothetical protein V7158_25165, partial [Priestia megaterium]|uniref:hypothetical protein n=1 Tax=Priestia megaterium TaxID=1404 RepID=UPI002FFD8855